MEIIIRTTKKEEIIDITEKVKEAVNKLLQDENRIVCNKKSRACLIYTPHTTCSLTITEGADSNVSVDLMNAIENIVPKINYKHEEGNSPAHVKSILIGVSLMIPFENGGLGLGTWQKIFFLEFDGPKERKVTVKIL